jgi:hypothetical protein
MGSVSETKGGTTDHTDGTDKRPKKGDWLGCAKHRKVRQATVPVAFLGPLIRAIGVIRGLSFYQNASLFFRQT